MVLILKYGYKKDPRFTIQRYDRLYIKTRVWEDEIEPGTVTFTTFQQLNEVTLDFVTITGRNQYKLILPEGYYLEKDFASKIYKELVKPKLQTTYSMSFHIEDYLTTVNPDVPEETRNVVPFINADDKKEEEPIFKYEEVKNQQIDYTIKGN